MVLRCLLVSIIACLIGLAPAEAGKRVALVIGNAAYENAPVLANPKTDAVDVAAVLEQLGFVVISGHDLKKADFDKLLRDFSRGLEDADVGLLFYAGHGLQIGGQNYLVPVDAKLSRERDLEFEAVRLEFLLRQMELDREGKTNIVFLDACRDNPLARNLARSLGTRSASVGSGLAQVQTGVGTFVAYSTQPGNVALDGDGRNSPFTGAFVRHVKVPSQSLNAIMINVRKDVLAQTNGRQVPWDHSALTGDFYFDLAKAPADGANGADPVIGDRMRQLEDELKRRTGEAAVASNATLVQLRQQYRQMEDATRRDRERMFRIQREQSQERDTSKRMDLFQETSRIQIEMSRRAKDLLELKAEIEKVEKNLVADRDMPVTGGGKP